MAGLAPRLMVPSLIIALPTMAMRIMAGCITAVSVAALAVSLLAACPARAQTGVDLADRSVLRVCADPANLPYSNERGEGFENKIVEVLAAKMDVPVVYTFFPQATGFIRNTLMAKRCDVVPGYPQGGDMVLGTNPYYRTAYAFVTSPGSPLADVASLDDPRLKDARIGIVAGTPPATTMALLGLMRSAKPYPLVVDTRRDSPAARMTHDIASGVIDAGVLWGPMAGWFARQQDPPLIVTPLTHEAAGPRMIYRMVMGVRPNEIQWKRDLNRLLRESQDEIDAILAEYGVPLLDGRNRPLEPATSAPAASAPAGAPTAAPAEDTHGAAATEGATDRDGAQASRPRAPEPSGYRMDRYRSPTPATLEGARVVATNEAKRLWDEGSAVFIDVLPRNQRPENLPADIIWRDPVRNDIPGSLWLPEVGRGRLTPESETYLRAALAAASGGNRNAPLVFYCLADCWMSWNAAKRAMTYGYSRVIWYPDGTDGWAAAGLPLAAGRPYQATD